MTLAGKRVMVTRAAEDKGALDDLLRARGAEVVSMPCIAFADDPDGPGRLAAAKPELVVVASPHAARIVARAGLKNVRYAVAGRGTAAALGRDDAIVPAEGAGAEALVATLAPLVRGRAVVVARAAEGNPALVEGLAAAGALVEVVTLYRTIVPERADPAALAGLRDGRIDAIAFGSGSAVRGFVALAGPAPRAKVVCMGQLCASEARAAGLPVHAVGDGGFAELCDAIERALG